MAQFNWSAPPSLDPNGTIAALMLRGPEAMAQAALAVGQARARAAEQAGQAQANAAQQSGQAWGNAIQGIGSTIAGIPGQIQQQKLADQKLAFGQAQLDDIQQRQAGEKALNSMMSGGQPLREGDEGPQAPSYLTEEGLWDVPKLNRALSQSGFAQSAPELLKGAAGINDSITKHQELEQKAAQQHAVLLGDMADTTLKLVKASDGKMSIPDAMDMVVQPALATKRFSPQEYAQVREKLASLPPEQQAAALTSMMDAVANVGGETLADGAQRRDRFGRLQAENPKDVKPPQPTEASLAVDAANPNSPTAAASKQALDLLRQQKNPPSLEEQYLKAVADGKPDAAKMIADTWRAKADASGDPVARAQLEAIRNITVQEARARLDDKDTGSDKNQQKFEQQYRTVLTRAMSSRSGGIGLEDAKVQQANHLTAVLDQFYDPKTGEWNIPRVQLNELALGLARLTAPGGQAGEGMLREFQQRTAKGDLAGALTYITGSPVPANTQAITAMLKDSIERQGKTAEQNREGEMAYLRGLAPTDLNDDRRAKLEATSLNPLRQSRVIQNSSTGERKLQISTDGGKTWQ